MKKSLIEEIIENGKSKQIVPVVKEALDNGADPISLINTMTNAMKAVGENFQNGVIQIADMFSSAQAMKKGIKFVTPLIAGTNATCIGTAIVGMAKGDLHDIGKGLVVTMLESTGINVIDLGIDVSAETFAEAIRENPGAKILAVSSSMESSIFEIKATVDYLKKEKLRDNVKIIVGGAAVDLKTAEAVGADAYAATATLTAVLAKDFLLNNN